MKKLKVELRKNLSSELMRGATGYLEGFSYTPYGSIVLVYFPKVNSLIQLNLNDIYEIGYEEVRVEKETKEQEM